MTIAYRTGISKDIAVLALGLGLLPYFHFNTISNLFVEIIPNLITGLTVMGSNISKSFTKTNNWSHKTKGIFFLYTSRVFVLVLRPLKYLLSECLWASETSIHYYSFLCVLHL